MCIKTRMFAAALVAIVTTAWTIGDEPHVKDLPIPEGATDISYMKRRGDIRFKVETDFKPTGEWYATQLGAQRWTKSGKDNLQKNFWVQKFAKGKLALEVRVDRREGGSEVRLTPSGLLWEEDLAPHVKDLPMFADATDVEFDDFFESIEFNSSSNVKAIADFYTENLDKLEWAKSGKDQVTERFVSLNRTKGQSTVTINIRAEESGTNVAIRTKGMNWSGIKKSNSSTKKSSTKSASNSPSKSKPEAEPAPPPKRKDKPKQGIADLPKLPNEGTVTLNDKPFKLNNVIAYEAFSRGQWSTKILATEKPIKQEALLAKLKNPGKDGDQSAQAGEGLELPQPYLQVDLDEDDHPERLFLRVENTPGLGSGSDLAGTALVEDGRARGTVKLKKPGDFFDKVYTAEISFDVPVLTRDSAPSKRLAGAPKIANSGTLTMGNKNYKLNNAVAYQMKRFDEPVTAIVLSEKPLNMAKLKASLGKKSIDDYFEFVPQVKLVVNSSDKVSGMSIWVDNISVSGNGELGGDIVIEDGRARGTAKMLKTEEFFDKKYTFEVSFDVDVLGYAAAPAAPGAPGGLVADSYDGLPIPDGRLNISSSGSKFRKEINATVPSELDAVVRFYRHELSSAGWKENAKEAKVEPQSAKLAFAGATGTLNVQLKADGSQTAITLISRDAQAAKAAGVLPAPGKIRLIVGNDSDSAATIAINKQDYSVAAGAGAKDPKTGLNWELAPGKYTIEVKVTGGKVQSETLTIAADETWGVIVDPARGFLALQVY